MSESTSGNRPRFGGPRGSAARRAEAKQAALRGPVEDAVPWGLKVGAAWGWRLLVIAAVLALLGFLVVQLRYLVIPLLIAVLLGALLVPVVDWLQRKGWPRWLGVTVTELGLLAVLGAALFFVIDQIRRGAADLAAQSVVAWESFRDWLLTLPVDLTQQEIDAQIAQIGTWIQQDYQVLVSGALSVSTTLGHVITGLVLALFATIFVLFDGRQMWSWIVRLFPRRARRALDGGGKAGWISLVQFVRAQILVASIDAVGIGLGAAVLGLPLAFPIAVLVFLGSFIPIVGAILTGAVAVFIALVYQGWLIALIMLGIVLLVQQVEGHYLQPKIMSTAVKLHPLAVVIAVAGGAMVAGISGALFAVPVVAFLNTSIAYVASGDWRKNPDPRPEDVLPGA